MPLLIRLQLNFVNCSQPSEPRNSANFYLIYPLLIQFLSHHFGYGCYGRPCIATRWETKATRSWPRSNKPLEVTRSWSLNKLPEVSWISLKEKKLETSAKITASLLTCIFFFHLLFGISKQDCNRTSWSPFCFWERYRIQSQLLAWGLWCLDRSSGSLIWSLDRFRTALSLRSDKYIHCSWAIWKKWWKTRGRDENIRVKVINNE